MKKGFTLVEILGVIVIIGFLVIMVIPAVTNIIRNSREELYKVQIKNIENAAKNWAAENPFKMPREDGETITLFLHNLHEGGFIETGIINPITGEEFPRDMIIEIIRNLNSYEYKAKVGLSGITINFKNGDPNFYIKGSLDQVVIQHGPFPGASKADVVAATAEGTKISDNFIGLTVTHNDVVVPNVDVSELGVFYVEYTLNYEDFSATIIRKITVVEGEVSGLVITLLGENPDTVSCHATNLYNDPGATVDDPANPDAPTIYASPLELKNAGNYTLYYSYPEEVE